jgi:hypothetical protein
MAVIKLAPRFKKLPQFDPLKTKPARIAEYCAAGKDYQTAIRETDREFQMWAAEQQKRSKAEPLKEASDYADEEARAASVG